MLATWEDANEWLDQNKIGFIDAAEAQGEADNADTLVRGKLAPIFGVELVNSWEISANNVPKIVREVASLYMAAFLYERKYSLESLDEADYAKRLMDRANKLIEGLRDGSIVIIDADVLTTVGFGREDFWPNNLTEKEARAKFRMGAEF